MGTQSWHSIPAVGRPALHVYKAELVRQDREAWADFQAGIYSAHKYLMA